MPLWFRSGFTATFRRAYNLAYLIVWEPNTFLRSVASPYEKVIFALERSYITSAMRKSMLDVQVPGSFLRYRPLNLRPRGFRLCETMWFKLGKN